MSNISKMRGSTSELDHKEIWAPKNQCFWTVVLEKTLESSLDWKEMKPVNPKGNQYSLEGLMLKLKLQILWPPHMKNWLLRKEPVAGKDWRQEEKGTTEDEMVGWHHWLDGHESELRELVMDREPWHAVIHGVAKSWTRLSNWTDWLTEGETGSCSDKLPCSVNL